MSKKDFKGGLNTLLGEQPQKEDKRGRPKTVTTEDVRATFLINEEYLQKIKAIAYWDRLTIKEVFNTAIEEAITKYEEKKGKIKPIPAK